MSENGTSQLEEPIELKEGKSADVSQITGAIGSKINRLNDFTSDQGVREKFTPEEIKDVQGTTVGQINALIGEATTENEDEYLETLRETTAFKHVSETTRQEIRALIPENLVYIAKLFE
jgi:hypothetical protein